jgi:hypothetical protein
MKNAERHNTNQVSQQIQSLQEILNRRSKMLL